MKSLPGGADEEVRGVQVQSRRAVFLDRDGVLNRTITHDGQAHSPRRLEDFCIIPGTREALQALKDAGFLLIVATNQPEVARGLQTRLTVEQMHQTLRWTLPVDDIFVCYHDNEHGCPCRKPQSGLILQAANEWEISLADSYMIGDRDKDVEAGKRAGCRSILLTADKPVSDRADYVALSIHDAVTWILAQQSGHRSAGGPI